MWFASRNSRAFVLLAAKLMFSGSVRIQADVPVHSAADMVSSFDETMPTTLPLESSNGPPLLPG